MKLQCEYPIFFLQVSYASIQGENTLLQCEYPIFFVWINAWLLAAWSMLMTGSLLLCVLQLG